VLAVALCTRVVKADDPLLTAPNVVRSTRLAALAQLIRERIDAKVQTYATVVLSVPQLVNTATHMASRGSLRCPYQARFISTLEPARSNGGRMRVGFIRRG